jgi:hypothetical protein
MKTSGSLMKLVELLLKSGFCFYTKKKEMKRERKELEPAVSALVHQIVFKIQNNRSSSIQRTAQHREFTFLALLCVIGETMEEHEK